MPEPIAASSGANPARQLPSVDALLRQPAIENLQAEFPRAELTHCVRLVLDRCRQELLAGQAPALDTPTLALAVRAELHRRRRPSLRRVINATGVVLHTGLGRAPLAEEAVEAVADVARGYSNLEFDLGAARRGDRHDHVRELLCELTGAADALVVNNNAAATYLALNTLAAGRGAIVSRGQLVEIGGSYRMPDIMAAAGCRMVEVGTTNRTHLHDYARAIDAESALIVRVHTSNYRIRGFTAAPTIDELVRLARGAERDLHVVDDLGSGLLLESAVPESGAPPAGPRWDEPTVSASIRAGADLVLFSGDKLLGGPQAGVILGRGELLTRLRANPLMRALRPDKLTLAALEATLRLYRDPDALTARLPALHMLTRPPDALRAAAEDLARQITAHRPNCAVRVEAGTSWCGGGALPDTPLPTWLVRVTPDGVAPESVAAALRQRDTPVICRLQDQSLVFDVRTLRGDEAEQAALELAATLREWSE